MMRFAVLANVDGWTPYLFRTKEDAIGWADTYAGTWGVECRVYHCDKDGSIRSDYHPVYVIEGANCVGIHCAEFSPSGTWHAFGDRRERCGKQT